MSRIERPAHAVSVDLPVAFHHCDPLGVVWHGRYFEFLELARTALLRSVQLDVAEIRVLGFRLYVTDAHCRYMVPLAYGQTARVTAWFSALTPLMRVAYDVYDGAHAQAKWCARATTVLATTDAAGVLLTRTPDAILDRLPAR